MIKMSMSIRSQTESMAGCRLLQPPDNESRTTAALASQVSRNGLAKLLSLCERYHKAGN
jgi:hypothetical protein